MKYKKHEWILLAFEKEQRIFLLWVNKGLDNTSVSISIPLEHLVERASEKKNPTTVLIFHNHPNPDPRRLIMSNPSDADKRSASKFEGMLTSRAINLVEFICERGTHNEYWRAVHNGFFPKESFVADIMGSNDSSWSINVSLHIERLFG